MFFRLDIIAAAYQSRKQRLPLKYAIRFTMCVGFKHVVIHKRQQDSEQQEKRGND